MLGKLNRLCTAYELSNGVSWLSHKSISSVVDGIKHNLFHSLVKNFPAFIITDGGIPLFNFIPVIIYYTNPLIILVNFSYYILIANITKAAVIPQLRPGSIFEIRGKPIECDPIVIVIGRNNFCPCRVFF